MNIIRSAIIFTLITIPFYFIIYENTTRDYERIKYENNFTKGVSNAIYDAKFVMNETVLYSVGDEDDSHLNIDEKEVVDAFLTSYYMYFNAGDEVTKAILRSNILALVVLDYDGFYIYGATEKDGVFDHALSEKHPYKYEDGARAYFFNMGDEVEIVDLASGDIDYESLGYLFDGSSLEDDELLKSRAINKSIIAELKSILQNHRKLGELIGSSFDYFLPVGKDSDFAREIDSVGLITIVEGEGYPKMGKVSKFDYSEADIEMNSLIFAFEKDGNKYYTANEKYIAGDYLIFNSKKEAARAGYFPYLKDIIK